MGDVLPFSIEARVDPVVVESMLEVIAWKNAANIGVKLLDARDVVSAKFWSLVEGTVSPEGAVGW